MLHGTSGTGALLLQAFLLIFLDVGFGEVRHPYGENLGPGQLQPPDALLAIDPFTVPDLTAEVVPLLQLVQPVAHGGRIVRPRGGSFVRQLGSPTGQSRLGFNLVVCSEAFVFLPPANAYAAPK